MRSRVIGTWIVTALLVVGGVVLASCAKDDTPSSSPALPPIVTTAPPTTPPPSVATTLPQYYEVQRGDTLTKIAAAYGLPVQAILELNGMTDPDQLAAGQILALPSRDIVANALPPTVPGQTAPTLPGETTTTVTTSAAP
ncbi:LysM peptidoglycan-binding domain-containing protein [Desertimonas flava]|jgi:LysM repeat protein|uniref:LysM peptidoglycan-binding domain-containing protein n=1 Tax=Desertimonas flava TaxID=2064846 RepID=UPI000E3417AB|nr:LysM domain-containing protein [Desertimonas flava]